MKRTSILALCLFFAVFGVSAAFAVDGGNGPVATNHEGPLKYAEQNGTQISKVYTGVNNGFSKAGTDTFYLYGGPPSFAASTTHPAPTPWPDGMFQTFIAGGSPQQQGWTSEDLTEAPIRWHGTTLYADTAPGGPPAGFTGISTNQCVASHHVGITPDYTGYGNGWKDWLIFDYDMTNVSLWTPAASANVQFTAEYKIDLETCCDFLTFEWYSAANGWTTLLADDVPSYNTTSMVYEAKTFDSGTIPYTPADYSGNNIRLRIALNSDSGWSDEDGRNSNGRGGAFVDNINVYVDGNLVSNADWEGATIVDQAEGDISGINNGSTTGTAGWVPTASTFNGDFSKIIGAFIEGGIDVCRENNTPMLSWINDGTGCNNDPLGPNNASGIPAAVGPGGLTYGIPSGPGAGTVFEYQGGLLPAGDGGVYNKWISPVIDINPPGSSPTNGGFWMGYTIWSDLPPVPNYIFWRFSVRSHDPNTGGWTPWQDCTYHYYGASTAWGNGVTDITDKVYTGADLVQIGFMGRDAAIAFTGAASGGATPAPEFDNVWVKRFEIGGPVITVPTNSLFNDGFPSDGTTTSAVRFDPGANIGGTGASTTVYVPQDSLAVEVKTIIPGTSLAGFGKMFVAQCQNPAFDQVARDGQADVNNYTLAGSASDPAHSGWDIYTFDVDGQQSTVSGSPVADTYFFDLPDGPGFGLFQHLDENALVFPGDVVHYYLEFQDTQATPGVSRTVADISDFMNFGVNTTFPRAYTMRGLPTVFSGGGQPSALWWNDVDTRGNDNEIILAFAQNGMLEGRDYDTYVTKGASSGMGNGLGSAGEHGATAGQLAGYDCLFYTLQSLKEPALSNGNKGVNGNDWADDVSLVQDWHNQSADRFSAYFGENFGQAMSNQANGSFLANVLGVSVVGPDMNVAHNLDDQTAALVKPTGATTPSNVFTTNYSPYGGCLVINDWDVLQPASGSGAVVAHAFTQPDGTFYDTNPADPTTVRAGSIYWDRLESGFRKVDITFPYDPLFIRDQFTNPSTTGPNTARAYLFGEILGAFGKSAGTATGAGVLPKKLTVSQNYPNPFNPSTTIKYSMPAKGQVSIKVYNLHGALVTTLVDGIMGAGNQQVIWNGKDIRGASVSTGIYLYKVKTRDSEVVKKMALIK